MVIGASLTAGGAPWAGGLLIASGIMGLGNRVLQETGGWQVVAAWFTKSIEHQKRLVQKLENGSPSIFPWGIGLAGEDSPPFPRSF